MKQLAKILPEALLQFNILSQNELEQFSREAKISDLPLRDYLLSNNLVQEKQLLIALSQHLNIDMADFRSIEVTPEAINRVPLKIAWYYRFMPVAVEGNKLKIATAVPLDVKIQDEIRVHLGIEVVEMLALESEVHEALKKYYGFASDTIEQILTHEEPKQTSSSYESGQWIEDLEQHSDNPTVSHLVNQILLEAYRKRATDIHIEPYRDKVRFRYRIDGVLVDANLPANVKHFLLPILSRIKIMANLSITEKRLPQDGSAVVKTKDQHLDLRISTMPTPRGESMVIRILPTKVIHFSLEKLGFNPESIRHFRKLIKKPHGIIFITGPTGSGKTTTLYACLNEINAPGRKIITIEDPVEYEMEGITQVQVNSKAGFGFATGLRSLLRHDPDIIMVGEVRDLETAEISIRTALTGHLVFSTLHTNDASSGITRLIDMGVEAYLVASSVEAFVAQRLVRVICPECKEEDHEPMTEKFIPEIRESLSLSDDHPIKIFKGKGCDRCNYTGYYGRIAIYEILKMNDAIRASILEKPRSDYIKQIAVQQGLVTLRQNAWQAVLDGLTTPDEVLHVTVKDKPLSNKAKSKGLKAIVSEVTQDVREEVKEEATQPPNAEWSENAVIDSRFYERKAHHIPIHYRLVRKDPDHPNCLVAEEREHKVLTVDLSAGGVSFASATQIPEDTVIEMRIFLDEPKKTLECLAKVCRIERGIKEGSYLISVFYLDMSNEDRALINQFMAAHPFPLK